MQHYLFYVSITYVEVYCFAIIAIQAHLKEEHNIIWWYKTVHEGLVNMGQAAMWKLVYDRYTANDDNWIEHNNIT